MLGGEMCLPERISSDQIGKDRLDHSRCPLGATGAATLIPRERGIRHMV